MSEDHENRPSLYGVHAEPVDQLSMLDQQLNLAEKEIKELREGLAFYTEDLVKTGKKITIEGFCDRHNDATGEVEGYYGTVTLDEYAPGKKLLGLKNFKAKRHLKRADELMAERQALERKEPSDGNK